jgi:hypothetical protein
VTFPDLHTGFRRRNFVSRVSALGSACAVNGEALTPKLVSDLDYLITEDTRLHLDSVAEFRGWLAAAVTAYEFAHGGDIGSNELVRAIKNTRSGAAREWLDANDKHITRARREAGEDIPRG